MIVSLWSVKGGVGCSVAAALVALGRTRAAGEPVALVDVCGDLPLVLGGATPPEQGLVDWLTAGHRAPPDGLGRIVSDVGPGLGLVGCGSTGWSAEAVAQVPWAIVQLSALPGAVVIDAGSVLGGSCRAQAAGAFAAHADRSLLVTRACYLALSRVRYAPVTPSGVILLRERDRCLGADDVAGAVGAPVVAEIEVDPAVARAVDAGLLAARPPRGAERTAAAVL